jgi:uncharacterized protein YkwD
MRLFALALAAENIGAGFLTFGEMLKQREDSRGHRENLLMKGARRVGVAYVAGDGDYGLT